MSKPFDLHDYSDIICLPHHQSATRRKMSNVERGAQFSPFSALTGYGEAICETERQTDEQRTLSEEEKAVLDVKLRLLEEYAAQRPPVTVRYFVPDARKDGGAYALLEGRVRAVDSVARFLVMEDRTRILIDRISDISGDFFAKIVF